MVQGLVVESDKVKMQERRMWVPEATLLAEDTARIILCMHAFLQLSDMPLVAFWLQSPWLLPCNLATLEEVLLL